MNKNSNLFAIGLVLLASACTPSKDGLTLVHATQPARWRQIAVSNAYISSSFARITSDSTDTQIIELLLNLKQQGENQQRYKPYMSIVETWDVKCDKGVGQVVAQSYFAKAMAGGASTGSTDFVPRAAKLHSEPVVLELCRFFGRYPPEVPKFLAPKRTHAAD